MSFKEEGGAHETSHRLIHQHQTLHAKLQWSRRWFTLSEFSLYKGHRSWEEGIIWSLANFALVLILPWQANHAKNSILEGTWPFQIFPITASCWVDWSTFANSSTKDLTENVHDFEGDHITWLSSSTDIQTSFRRDWRWFLSAMSRTLSSRVKDKSNNQEWPSQKPIEFTDACWWQMIE